MDYKKELLNQLQLEYLPPHNDTSTSQKAAIEIAKNFHTIKDKVHQFIISCDKGGANNAELCEYLKLRPQTASSVANNLWEKEDKIRKSGKVRASKDTNRDNEIWLAKEFVEGDFGKHPGYRKVQTDKDTLNIYENYRTSGESNGSIAAKIAKYYNSSAQKALRNMSNKCSISTDVLLAKALISYKNP